jgi:methyl-accepting chemotaxis protein
MESLFKSQATTTAKSLSEMVQMALTQEMNTLKAFSVDASMRKVTAKVTMEGNENQSEEIENLQQQLKAIVETAGQNYEDIVIFDRQGVSFADSVEGKRKGVSVAEREYFKTALQGKCAFGEMVLSKATGKPIIPLAAPIYSDKEEVVGVLCLILKSDYLIEKITRVKIGQTGFAVMVDKKGITIAHPDKSLIFKNDIKAMKGMEELTRGALEGETGTATYVINGVKKLSGYAPVELTGWSVLVSQSYDEILAPIRSMQKQILLAGGMLLAFVIGLIFLLGRKISNPITQTAQGLSAASDHVLSASRQISSASQHVALGASEQAAAIEEISSSLEEMTSMIRQSAENADQANSLTVETRNVVVQASQSMEQLTTSMTAISNASQKTQKIIRTIDEIAFQTNLLALNAAVEAARAGEAGAGFAVVADEVRSLALRAAEASKNTTGLIEEMVRRIKEGSETLKKTENDFTRVEAHASKVAKLMNEISAASREQAQGISQISRGVSQMDQVVQQNAASAEESASFSEQMNNQAEQMRVFTSELSALIGGIHGGANVPEQLESLATSDARFVHAALLTNCSSDLSELANGARNKIGCGAGFAEVEAPLPRIALPDKKRYPDGF